MCLATHRKGPSRSPHFLMARCGQMWSARSIRLVIILSKPVHKIPLHPLPPSPQYPNWVAGLLKYESLVIITCCEPDHCLSALLKNCCIWTKNHLRNKNKFFNENIWKCILKCNKIVSYFSIYFFQQCFRLPGLGHCRMKYARIN
jgi:hypothetical protein